MSKWAAMPLPTPKTTLRKRSTRNNRFIEYKQGFGKALLIFREAEKQRRQKSKQEQQGLTEPLTGTRPTRKRKKEGFWIGVRYVRVKRVFTSWKSDLRDCFFCVC